VKPFIKSLSVKRWIIFVMIIITFELLAWSIIHVFQKESYRDWVQIELPQKVNSLTWFERYHRYHPFLSYDSLDIRQSLSEVREKKRTGSTRIAVLGGSFANIFANYLRGPEGSRVLSSLIKKTGLRDLEVYNLATGAYRQPQQLIATVLFGQDFDFFLSVEGYNELRRGGGIRCLPPSWNMMSLRYMKGRHPIYKKLASFYKSLFLTMNETRKLGLSVLDLLFYWLNHPIYQSTHAYYEKHLDSIGGECREKERDDMDVVDLWMEAIIKQHAVTQGLQKPLVTVFQPNQYNPGSKVWSPDEKKSFLGGGERMRHIQRIYPLAVQRFNELSKESPRMSMVDMTNVFRAESQTIYIDKCCHINDVGNEIFLRALWPHLGPALKKSQAQRRSEY
jgi:hypothetical protein